MPISQEQLDQIVAKVNKLVTDKSDADTKTQASNTADTIAAQANATAAQAKLDEAAADSVTSSDLQDLTTFLDSLVVTPPAPPA